MIAAVIVTYNRKDLLAENIEMLLRQTRYIDKIFIIDNCSTDGTYQYLQEKGWIDAERFVYIKTESNIGGAGGFFTGTKAAYEAGADWIIQMDDDGKAADEDTFDNLMLVAEDMYHKDIADRKIYVNALVQQGEFLSFKMGNKYTVAEAIDAAVNGIIENEANPFNGTVISRELIAAVGYPNKDFFIKGDEVDYKQRSLDSGAYVCTVVNARYTHPRPVTNERTVLGKRVPFFVEAPWKEYYAARNFTYMYKLKKQYKAIAFELFFIKMLAIVTMGNNKFRTIQMVFKGINDGWHGRLGATIKP